MGVMHKNTASGAGVNNPGASAETIVYTTPVLGPVGVGTVMGISGTVNVTAGTGTTAVTLRCRQGNTVTGPQVGPSQPHTLAAAASASISFGVTDPSTYLQAVGGQYVITAQQTGGTGAGTTNFVDIEVLV